MTPCTRLRAALVAAFLLAPAAARGSGVVPVPVTLETVVQRSSVVVVGRTLGTREARVRIPIGETQLPPRGRTFLELTVRQVGVRVRRVLRADPRGLVRDGDELWLTDPGDYDVGAMGELAQVATVTQERFQPGERIDLQKLGKAVIAFAESSGDRAARGRRVAGLPDAWWQAAAGAFETPTRQADVERLVRGARRPSSVPR